MAERQLDDLTYAQKVRDEERIKGKMEQYYSRHKEDNTGKCEKCGEDLVMDYGGNWTCHCDEKLPEIIDVDSCNHEWAHVTRILEDGEYLAHQCRKCGLAPTALFKIKTIEKKDGN